jgi:hypothetical protein
VNTFHDFKLDGAWSYPSYFDYPQPSDENDHVTSAQLHFHTLVITSHPQENYLHPVCLNLSIRNDVFSIQNLSLTISLKSVKWWSVTCTLFLPRVNISLSLLPFIINYISSRNQSAAFRSRKFAFISRNNPHSLDWIFSKPWLLGLWSCRKRHRVF